MIAPSALRPLLLLTGGAIALAAFRLGQNRAQTALSRNEAERIRLRILGLAHDQACDPAAVVIRAETYLDFVKALSPLMSSVRAAMRQKYENAD